MKTIDGSRGEGGGQVLRTALSLSMVTGEPFRIERIRAGRARPGLLRQHLTCIQAAKTLCGATVEGDEPGSCNLTFRPGSLRSGEHAFAVGSAGSATLVFQTVLPALLCADAPTTLTIEGGTHNPNAPPFDHLAKVFLPLVARFGPRVEVNLERTGFYPSGGGRFVAQVQPVAGLGRLELLERGAVEALRVRAVVAGLSKRIAERECVVLRDALGLERWAVQSEEVEGTGPGNVVMVEVRSANLTELFTGFGERGVPAEEVALRLAAEVKQHLATDIPVGEYLADQLLLPLALGAGGRFRTGALSSHATTQLELLREWLGLDIRVREAPSGGVEVEVGRA